MEMNITLEKPSLWSYGEAAIILGLDPKHGRRTVSELVKAHKLKTKFTGGPAKGLNRDDLEFLAKLLNRSLPS